MRARHVDARASAADGPFATGSIARGSIVRFAADGAALVAGLMASIVIARALGPAAKGDYATAIYLVGLLSAVATMGMGDANIILVSQQVFRLNEAVRYSSTLVTGASILVASPAMFGVTILLLQGDGNNSTVLASIAALAVPLSALSNLFNTSLLARHRVVFTSIVLVVTSWVVAASLALAIILFDGGVAEAVLATVIGAIVSLAIAGGGLVREGWRPRPGLSKAYALKGLRLGFPLQAASLLMLMSARIDLLFVHGFLGSSSAGFYSVSLMIGQLVLYAPVALSLVTFPRLAQASDEEARRLGGMAFRATLITASAVAVVLAVATPFVVPLLFGREFTPAIAPALLLLVGGVIWSEQWALARAVAARGLPSVLFVSSGAAVLTMVIADVVLIPWLGLWGAAIASDLAALVGTVVCVRRMQRGEWTLSWADLLPGREDLLRVASLLSRRRQAG